MKKKFLSLGVIAILIIMLVTLTGCENKQEDIKNNLKESEKVFDRSKLKVGDYVEYQYDTADNYILKGDISGYKQGNTYKDQEIKQEQLRFRIYNIDEKTGRVDLISATPTRQKIIIGGSSGYNNGVYFLNEIAEKQYSNASLGIKARSIKIEDIENKMTDKGKENILNYIGEKTGIRYGDVKTYTGTYSNYPTILKDENGVGINTEEIKNNGLSRSDIGTIKDKGFEKADTLTVKQNAYVITRELKESIDGTAYNLLYPNSGQSDMWIASRGTFVGTAAGFGLFHSYGNGDDMLGAYRLCSSTGEDETTYSDGRRIRVMVSIEGNVNIEAHEGTMSNMHIIK